MTISTWSDAELADELRDMREHVPHTIGLVDAAEEALDDQRARSRYAYGHDGTRWPAATCHTIAGLEARVRSAQDEYEGAREYLRELEAEEGRRRNT